MQVRCADFWLIPLPAGSIPSIASPLRWLSPPRWVTKTPTAETASKKWS